MPGYARWKQLYKEEYFQMKEEGFDLSGIATPEEMLFKLPVPMQAEDAGASPDNERCWKQAYEELVIARLNRLKTEQVDKNPEK